MKIKVLDEKCNLPQTESEGSAGYDIWGIFDEPICWHESHSVKMIRTGFSTEFDSSYVARVWERGSTGSKNLEVRAGVIDSNFRGEWKILLKNGNPYPFYYIEGEEEGEVFKSHVESLKNMYYLAMGGSDNNNKIVYEKNMLYIQDRDSDARRPLAGVYSQEKAIAQFVMVKIVKPEMQVVEELSQTRRGEGMLGSSGH